MRNLTKTFTLLRFNLRADWVKLAIWLICIAGLVLAVGFKFDSIYGSDTALATITVTLNSASMVALLGAFGRFWAPLTCLLNQASPEFSAVKC